MKEFDLWIGKNCRRYTDCIDAAVIDRACHLVVTSNMLLYDVMREAFLLHGVGNTQTFVATTRELVAAKNYMAVSIHLLHVSVPLINQYLARFVQYYCSVWVRTCGNHYKVASIILSSSSQNSFRKTILTLKCVFWLATMRKACRSWNFVWSNVLQSLLFLQAANCVTKLGLQELFDIEDVGDNMYLKKSGVICNLCFTQDYQSLPKIMLYFGLLSRWLNVRQVLWMERFKLYRQLTSAILIYNFVILAFCPNSRGGTTQRCIDISRYFSRDTYHDIIFYNCNFFFFFNIYCDFCKVIPQIHNYFVKIFCEILISRN